MAQLVHFYFIALINKNILELSMDFYKPKALFKQSFSQMQHIAWIESLLIVCSASACVAAKQWLAKITFR